MDNLEQRLDNVANGMNNEEVQTLEEDYTPVNKGVKNNSINVQQQIPVQNIQQNMVNEVNNYPPIMNNPIPDEVVEKTNNEVKHEAPVVQQASTVVENQQPVEEDEHFISDTFSKLKNEMNELPEEKPLSTKNILDGIKVDLKSIEIVEETDTIEMNKIENSILNDTTTMLVTCCQSSYTAEMSALKSQEIQSLINSDVDYYSYKKKLYQLINKHMENTSVGKMPYGNWLHNTSFFDLDTLLYGLYCVTFNYENKYSITCPSCRGRFDAIVNNNTLIELRGSEEETFAKISEIVNNVKNADELINNSLVHKTKRIILDESKIIIDIRIPSVYDYLEEVVAKSDDANLEEYQNSLGLILFVNQIYLPNILQYNKTGNLKYVKMKNTDKSKMLVTISNLSFYDSEQLSDEINDFVDKYRVTYSIRNLTCPHCGRTIGTIPMEMEDVLFNTIRRGRTK